MNIEWKLLTEDHSDEDRPHEVVVELQAYERRIIGVPASPEEVPLGWGAVYETLNPPPVLGKPYDGKRREGWQSNPTFFHLNDVLTIKVME